MNPIFHLVLGGTTTVFFLIAFAVQHKLYQLLFASLSAYTFLIYLSDAQKYHQQLGYGAMVLLVLTFLSLFLSRRKAAKAEKARAQHIQQSYDHD